MTGESGAIQRRSDTIDVRRMTAMRKTLLVIDMQNDFINGALGTAEEIKKYPVSDIIATRDTHGENYLDTQEGRNLPVPHCIKGTRGWELHPRIAEVLEGVTVIDKPTFGTDICVVSNALLIKAALPETPVRVIGSCCAGVTPESHRAALETMKMCQVKIE